MPLSHLKLLNFRNLSDVDILPSESFNIFFGDNGSGKTSLLESIYFLNRGKSFRTRYHDHVIQNNTDNFSIFAEIGDIPVGIEKHTNGNSTIRINRKDSKSISELAKIMPLIIINPDSYKLIDSGSKLRRNFLDWGVFHVEHEIFLTLWRKLQRIIKQRNVVLKEKFPSKSSITLWDRDLVKISEEITYFRNEYISKFIPEVLRVLGELLSADEIPSELTIQFYPGWDANNYSFQEILSNSIEKDVQYGYTNYGPHHADLKLLVNNRQIQEVFSRGQQKLLVFAMYLAQATLLKKNTGKKCVFLIDDLASELDQEKRAILSRILSDLDSQLFITVIESDLLSGLFETTKTKSFHVEHGTIIEV